jgi:hypothetical protein
MHTTTMTRPDRAALENLWGDAGTWAADTWTRLNADHFGAKLRYHGIVWGLTPHGHLLGYTSNPDARITLHTALLNPKGNAWGIRNRLGMRYAEDVLLHEMVHAALRDAGVPTSGKQGEHNTQPWCDQIVRITPQLGLAPIKAQPVKPRRIDGRVVRRALDGHLTRDQISRWPHTIRPDGFYTPDTGRIKVGPEM